MSYTRSISPRASRIGSLAGGNGKLDDTPNHQKLLDIAEHFNKQNNNQDSEKKMRLQYMENNFSALEREITNNSSSEAKFRVFRDDINNIQEKQSDEKIQREWQAEKFTKDVRVCEENVRTKVDSDQLQRREFEQKVLKGIDDKAFSLNVSHNRSFRLTEEDTKHKTDEIKCFLGDLREGIEAETVQREEGICLLTEQIEREVKKLGEGLTIENKIRNESCKKLTNMFDETCDKLRTIIYEERKDREENSDSILRLLEETCGKLDRKIHKY